MIERCAKGEALTELPRLPQPALSGGVRMLVDRGDAMMAYSGDEAMLERAIRTLVGDSKVEVLSFDGFPSRAGIAGGKRRWGTLPGTDAASGPVVAILSDLGMDTPPGCLRRPLPANGAPSRTPCAVAGPGRGIYSVCAQPLAGRTHTEYYDAPLGPAHRRARDSRPGRSRTPGGSLTSMAAVEDLIASLQQQNEKALKLAEAVSFAVRVEPFLLRRARLELLPDVDSGAEGDVWLSPLVQVRVPTASSSIRTLPTRCAGGCAIGISRCSIERGPWCESVTPTFHQPFSWKRRSPGCQPIRVRRRWRPSTFS